MEEHNEMGENRVIAPQQYDALAEFRYQIRAFLAKCDESARLGGIEPLEYQFLLSLKRHGHLGQVTVRHMAQRLHVPRTRLLRLMDMMIQQRLIERRKERRAGGDVFIHLTPKGEEKLHEISLWHCADLQARSQVLMHILDQLQSIHAAAGSSLAL